MNRWKAAFVVALAGLAISLAVEVRRSGRARDSLSSAAAASASPSPSATVVGRYDVACSVELAACRKQTWGIALEAIRTEATERLAIDDAGRDGGAPSAGREEQRHALDEIARKHLREHWKEKRAEILASVHDVGKDAWVHEEIDKTLEKISPALDLGDSERARMRQGYEALWSQHGPALQAILSGTPIDDHALLASVRSVFRDEDALFEEKLGHDASERYRAMDLENRTAILAILATFADEPWDDGIVW